MEKRSFPPVALTIAGSDSGGGAGIQADLKAFAANGVFGTSVIAAITAQGLRSVRAARAVPPRLVLQQLDAVLDDFPVAAIKTGMLGSAGVVMAVAKRLRQVPSIPLVVDPILRAGTGRRLATGPTLVAMREALFPLAMLVTPNIPECEALTSLAIASAADQERAAAAFYRLYKVAVLVKGGHLEGEARDLLFDGRKAVFFSCPRLDVGRTHGLGCTLSAAITAQLARGRALAEAVALAKAFVVRALENGFSHAGTRLVDPFWDRSDNEM